MVQAKFIPIGTINSFYNSEGILNKLPNTLKNYVANDNKPISKQPSKESKILSNEQSLKKQPSKESEPKIKVQESLGIREVENIEDIVDMGLDEYVPKDQNHEVTTNIKNLKFEVI